ncbi:MAG: polysaccharide biosynthesis/export family protein [Desulfovermiculus sp.]|nr:polysaccharide biosynthesis/export family protein [Desulfovermiculus sp.]
MNKTRHGFWLLVACCLVWFLAAPAVGWAEESNLINKEYLIKKGDVLEINVWKEEELTRVLKVRVDGKISLPLVDDIQAAGRTPMDLKETIQEALTEYIEVPQVTVIVQEQSGQYYLIGEVAGTGAYPLQRDLTVIQALAQAGGFTEWADKDSILLLRREQGEEKRIEVDYDAIVAGNPSHNNVLIQAGDTIIVP